MAALNDLGEIADFGTEQAVMPLRAVGGLERLFYRYSERFPTHFSIVAEFDIALTAEQVRSALDAVQQRHPLLAAHVDDSLTHRLGFGRREHVAPIPLRVQADTAWQTAAAEELSLPFEDRSAPPLMRAVLLTAPSRCALLLTFDHTIADGISSVMVLNDLIGVLNGQALEPLPLPEALETALARTFSTTQNRASEPVAPDPRMCTPSATRTFDGTPPEIRGVALTEVETRRLVERCRREGTTVHAAVVTAASRARCARVGEQFVRTMSPINIRPLLGVGSDCADYIICTVTGLALDGASFWNQARAVSAELTVARSAPGVIAGAQFVQDAMGDDADTATAEELFTRAVPFDLMITNLGVQDLEPSGPIRPAALWAPVVETQVAGGIVIGLVTYGGVLRLVTSGYAPPAGFLEEVSATLRSESAG